MIDSSVLWQYSLFNGLEQEQIDSILPLLEQESFDAGTDILVEGNHNDRIYFVLEGQVAVVKAGIILTEFGEGAVFGEMEVVDVMPVEATIRALTTIRAMSLSIDALGEIYKTDLKTYSFILMNLARDISRRLRHMDDKAAKHVTYMDWS
jgi:CRP-like cAMP-binding protein